MPKAEQATFKAWHDTMPGSPHKLIVVGTVEVPTTGWHVGLSEAMPLGINQAILILQVDSTKPSDPAGQVISHLAVRFEKAGGDAYKQVTVRGAGPDFTIEVGTAQ